MKYSQHLKAFVNNSGTNIYNPIRKTAYSYSSFKYLAEYKGKLVFNNHAYSEGTVKHQSDTLSLLNTDNIIILNNTPLCLSNIKRAITDNIRRLHSENIRLAAIIRDKKTLESTNKIRKNTIITNKKQINLLKSLLKD